jgi:hypothetical protein
MRSMLILIVTGGVVALSGVPILEPNWVPGLYASRLAAESLAGLSTPVVSSGGAMSEAVSLLLLGGGFFAAAIMVRRRS